MPQTVGLATTTIDGTVKLSTAPVAANEPIAVGDNDTRMTDARTPLTHTHSTSDITSLAEFIRDTIATALVAGTNVTITVDDPLDTITVAAAGGGSLADGDYGDVTVSSSGTVITVDNGTITLAKQADLATQRLIGRNSGTTGVPEAVTLTQLLDWIGSAAQGDILYRGSASWSRLAAGTAGQFLLTNGSSANPQWALTVPPHPGYHDLYYYSGYTGIAPGVLSLTQNRLHFIPFPCVEPTTWNRIGINVTTNQASAMARLGIYNNSGGRPTSLVLDAGEVDCSTTGEKEATISQALSIGWYWLALVTSVNTVGITAENAASSGDTIRINLGFATGAGNPLVYNYHSHTYGALPANASTLSDMTGASNIPRIWLRKGV